MWHISGIPNPYRINLFEDFIYGTGLKNEVFRINKYGKLPVELLDLGVEKATNIMVSHRFKQQEGEQKFLKISLNWSVISLMDSHHKHVRWLTEWRDDTDSHWQIDVSIYTKHKSKPLSMPFISYFFSYDKSGFKRIFLFYLYLRSSFFFFFSPLGKW